MEIKVQCDCGQKFKFDVEPVNGQMPFTVNCPVCGKDGTSRANVILQQMLPPPPQAAAMPPSAASAPAPMRPALSINRPHSAPAPAAPTAEAASEAAADEDASESGGLKVVQLGWKGWAAIGLVIGVGIVGSYLKSAQRNLVRDVLDWAVEKVTGKSNSEETGVPVLVKKNVLPDDDGTMLLIKATNHTEVARLCADFYAERNKQKLVSKVTNDHEAEGLFVVQPAHDGFVEVDGALLWNDKEAANLNAMTEFLARKLNTTAVCALMGDDAEAGVVTIYENGEKKFRCERSLRIKGGDLVEDVKIEGQEWVTGLGFQPGKDGWKGFTMYDADDLAQHLGFKPSDAAPADWIVLSAAPAGR